MAKKKEEEIPKLITLREILEKVKIKQDNINKLEEGLLEAKFFDTYKKYEEKDNIIKVYGESLTGEEDILEIDLKDKTLIYHETINGIPRQREYLRNGFDLSKIKQM